MISLDTNILFFYLAEDRPEHAAAVRFLDPLAESNGVLLCEFMLVELYRLLRNPTVLKAPLRPKEAAEVIEEWRSHSHWRLAGFPQESRAIHDELWRITGQPDFAYRRIYDARLALVLRHLGVTEFATANVQDFQGFGFRKVWNPLESE